MAAIDHFNPTQMKLFMSGTELRNSLNASIDKPDTWSMDQMWERKSTEAKVTTPGLHGAGVHESLKERGWVGGGPNIYHRRVGSTDEVQMDDAHHRIAAAADIEAESGGKRTIWIPTDRRFASSPRTASGRYDFDDFVM